MTQADTSERRRFHRILFDAPTTIESAGQLYHTTLLDISLKGALARIPPKWQPNAGEQVTLSIKLNEETDTIVDCVEPYLLKSGFLKRTNRGRMVTELAYKHLNISFDKNGAQDELF